MKKIYLKLTAVAVIAAGVMVTGCGGSKQLALPSLPSTASQSAYKVGDPYSKDGLTGLVVQATDDGKHGLIMSLSASGEKWCANKKLQVATEAFHEDDGAKNMEVIAKFVADGKGKWEDFPLFAWAQSLGEGWYIPANDELLDIALAINGGTTNYNLNAVLSFNKAKVTEYGGASLFDDKGMAATKMFCFMFSSTEAEGGKVYHLWPNTDSFGKAFKSSLSTNASGHQTYKGTILQPAPQSKTFSMNHASRAVHKF
ncbi:MAG: hypothetical protein LBJ57_02055 [Prevotellaceae bacterium]|jgi:hypothetical protein|nr:hypothetical protein [Prevotellaceae bacterium]